MREVAVGHRRTGRRVRGREGGWHKGGVRAQQATEGDGLPPGPPGARLPQSSLLPVSAPQNGILRGVYPGSPTSWLVVVMATVGSSYCDVDISMGLVCYIQRRLPEG